MHSNNQFEGSIVRTMVKGNTSLGLCLLKITNLILQVRIRIEPFFFVFLLFGLVGINTQAPYHPTSGGTVRCILEIYHSCSKVGLALETQQSYNTCTNKQFNNNNKGQALRIPAHATTATTNKTTMQHQKESILHRIIANIVGAKPKKSQLKRIIGDVSRATLKKSTDLSPQMEHFTTWSFQLVQMTSKLCRDTENTIFAQPKKFHLQRIIGDVSRATLKMLADLSLPIVHFTIWSFYLVQKTSKCCRNTANIVIAKPKNFHLNRIIGDVSRATLKKLTDLKLTSSKELFEVFSFLCFVFVFVCRCGYPKELIMSNDLLLKIACNNIQLNNSTSWLQVCSSLYFPHICVGLWLLVCTGPQISKQRETNARHARDSPAPNNNSNMPDSTLYYLHQPNYIQDTWNSLCGYSL
ncbi:uncharacterized protein LOC129873477 [Solanum dulcamara]|uniref:uncharacterized protein LOC129873477 n=1 Tax=Solanum dulcamara TaxID=45834 RepID=UPI0024861D88|nr:uncharacterized protein LOC129873477 [Solanum dulcamara]